MAWTIATVEHEQNARWTADIDKCLHTRSLNHGRRASGAFVGLNTVAIVVVVVVVIMVAIMVEIECFREFCPL